VQTQVQAIARTEKSRNEEKRTTGILKTSDFSSPLDLVSLFFSLFILFYFAMLMHILVMEFIFVVRSG
jgi:hypothetical protein